MTLQHTATHCNTLHTATHCVGRRPSPFKTKWMLTASSRKQGIAQSIPSTICCSLWHTTTITWFLPVLENQIHSGKNTSNLSHCAIYLWLVCWATPVCCVESLLYYSQPMRYYVEPLVLCWTTCASYATCHLKHTPLVLFPTWDLLSLFPSRALSSIHLCYMTFKLKKVDVTSPNLAVYRFFLRLTFCASLSFSLSLHWVYFFFLSWMANTYLNHWTKRVVSAWLVT